jgi:DNA-binding NtrC family response regulator
MNLRLAPNTNERPTAPGRVLVVDDHQQARESVAFTLRQAGHQVQGLSSAGEALKRLEREAYDVIVTDLKMPGMTGLEFLTELKRRQVPSETIMVTAYATVATAVEAMRQGAFDFLEKPFGLEELEDLVARALRQSRSDMKRGEAGEAVGDGSGTMIGSSPQMQALRLRIARAAPTGETVLICGESGTGKELVARTIHALGNRAERPLVSLNCPALSAHLMESELFGHERGAFTGAEQRRLGRFETADGGTLLLDEVTELDLPLQAKLLRVLQERSFERVGSSETIRVDVRVLATTNRNLRTEVASGRFREDLFYRLSVIPLQVPPLRERTGDVPELTDFFLAQAAERMGSGPRRFSAGAVDLLTSYRWPGNVRELQNVVTRAVVLSTGDVIDAEDVRPSLLDSGEAMNGSDANGAATALPVDMSLEEMERRMIEATLERFAGHRAKTAQALGIGLRTLTTKLKEYGHSPKLQRLAEAG